MTSNSISGAVDSIRFRGQATVDSDGSYVDGDPVSSAEVNGDAPGELGAGAEYAIDERPL